MRKLSTPISRHHLKSQESSIDSRSALKDQEIKQLIDQKLKLKLDSKFKPPVSEREQYQQFKEKQLQKLVGVKKELKFNEVLDVDFDEGFERHQQTKNRQNLIKKRKDQLISKRNKEEFFKKKFDNFKNLDTFIEVQDIINSLNSNKIVTKISMQQQPENDDIQEEIYQQNKRNVEDLIDQSKKVLQDMQKLYQQNQIKFPSLKQGHSLNKNQVENVTFKIMQSKNGDTGFHQELDEQILQIEKEQSNFTQQEQIIELPETNLDIISHIKTNLNSIDNPIGQYEVYKMNSDKVIKFLMKASNKIYKNKSQIRNQRLTEIKQSGKRYLNKIKNQQQSNSSPIIQISNRQNQENFNLELSYKLPKLNQHQRKLTSLSEQEELLNLIRNQELKQKSLSLFINLNSQLQNNTESKLQLLQKIKNLKEIQSHIADNYLTQPNMEVQLQD